MWSIQASCHVLAVNCIHAHSFNVVGIGRSNISWLNSSSSSLSWAVGRVRKGLNDSFHHFSSTRSFLVTVEKLTQYRQVTSFNVRSLLKARIYITGCMAWDCQQREWKCKTYSTFAQYEPTGCTILLSVYFNNWPLHVLSRFTAHQQAVCFCMKHVEVNYQNKLTVK